MSSFGLGLARYSFAVWGLLVFSTGLLQTPPPPRLHPPNLVQLLGGSWIVISGVISPAIWVRSIVTLPITLVVTTHEPPSILW